MTEKVTSLGLVKVGTQAELFAAAAALATEGFDPQSARPRICALSGGSTPQAWYRWCMAQRALPAAAAGKMVFTVSDERWVAPESAESNFGHATRLLLDPLGVPPAHRLPWPVELAPAETVARYTAAVAALAGAGRTYDTCFLGLGDDAHTASLFPSSPLLADDGGRLFAAVEVPGKGWRATITPTGLRTCGRIVVMATGAGKAAALRRVFLGNETPSTAPARLLQSCADRVVWLLDEAAAAGLA